RILAVMAKLLHKGGGKRGLISICTAGGMGVAAIVEGVEMHVLPKAEKPAEIAAGGVVWGPPPGKKRPPKWAITGRGRETEEQWLRRSGAERDPLRRSL